MACNRPPTPLDDINERELNFLRAMTPHRELAVAAALDYCAEYDVCPPRWLVLASAELTRELLKRAKSRKRGRAAAPIARYRQDLWDIERWDAVVAIRSMQKKVQREVELAQKYQVIGYLRRQEKMLNWLGRDWLRAYECAAMYLTGRNARVGPDAMKASFLRVGRTIANPDLAMKYHLLEESFLKKLGFEGLQDRKPGTKLLPLYNLTP